MKAYIMERERYDGADVAHLLWRRGESLDWPHLVRQFGPDRRVLLAHLILFGLIYLAQPDLVPAGIMQELLNRRRREKPTPNDRALCRGTLVSRAQYLTDVTAGGSARRTSRSALANVGRRHRELTRAIADQE